MKKILLIFAGLLLVAETGITVYFLLNNRNVETQAVTNVLEPAPVVEVKKEEPVKEKYYTGSLIQEFVDKNCYVQERYLAGHFKFYEECDLTRIREDKEDIPKVFDSIENKNCIYTLQNNEKAELHALRKYYNQETQEISYWVKISVNEVEGWFFLYTTMKPNRYFFENGFWVPYKQTFVEKDVEKEIWIRQISSGASLKRYSSFLPSPHPKAEYITGLGEQIYDDLNSDVYVGVIAMTAENDEEHPELRQFLIEKNGIEAWVYASCLGHGESGGVLFHGPVEEIGYLCEMGA